jgi:ribosome-associated protein YbcJ (S4-like RNA binding protein)
VNGEVETRKRRKMLGGDVVSFGTEEFKLRLAGATPTEQRSGARFH